MLFFVIIKIYVQIDVIVVFGFICCVCFLYRRVNFFCNKIWYIFDYKSEYIYIYIL